jgi:uncharacterized UBP type Zn finger protein
VTPFGSVQACLANAFCERMVEAKCNVCDADNHVQLTHKTTLMAPLPEVLVIHLKRWRMSRNQVKYVSHPWSDVNLPNKVANYQKKTKKSREHKQELGHGR